MLAVPDPDLIVYQPRVLITDASERAALAACRGLSRAGYRVRAAAFESLSVSQWSTSCAERLRVRDPRQDAEGFVADLRTHLERSATVAVIPGSDFSLRAVSRFRSELDGLTRLGLPDHDVVKNSFDRTVLSKAARLAGFADLAAVHVRDRDAARAAVTQIGLPVIVKSISSTIDHGIRISAGPDTRLVKDLGSLDLVMAGAQTDRLIQRAEGGRMISAGGVMADGRLIALAVSAYVRTWPPEAGNAAFSVTIDPPTGMPEAAERLLNEIGWQGLFELELIEREDGSLVAIDLNPRPYGSMALAIAAGANLPALWCDWLAGRGMPTERVHARAGCRYRWGEADLRNVAWQVRRTKRLAPTGALLPRSHVTHPHFRRTDPVPALVRVAFLIRRKLRARRRRRPPVAGMSA